MTLEEFVDCVVLLLILRSRKIKKYFLEKNLEDFRQSNFQKQSIV